MDKENRYTLTKEIDEKWTPLIDEYINTLKYCMEHGTAVEEYNLSGIPELTPSRVRDILVDKLGYEEVDFSCNGWEWDFWFYFKHKDRIPMQMRGTGMCFELFVDIWEEGMK